MTSKPGSTAASRRENRWIQAKPQEAYVWIWLPGAVEPVVAGRLAPVGDQLAFAYGQSYLARPDRISLFTPDLPLGPEAIYPLSGDVPGPILDAAPDSWGRQVILNQHVGPGIEHVEALDELTYLLESGSDRIGALDFQASPTMFVPRTATTATLDELAASAQKVIDGVPLSPTLDAALLRGSSIGGARPKALLEDGPRRLIAKFSAPRDPYPIVQAEFVAMRLAEHAGLRVAAVEITEALGKRVLLVERFDRLPGGGRRAMVSALTILGLHDDLARYATYWQLANTIRARFSDPDATLHELFARITFNILVSNNDDHARNHAAFWDGETLALTPAYDICPQPRAGNETEQVMEIGRDEFKKSQVVGCVERAGEYHLTAAQARQIIDHQIETIERRWPDVCDEAELTEVDRGRLRTRQFLNPYATEGY